MKWTCRGSGGKGGRAGKGGKLSYEVKSYFSHKYCADVSMGARREIVAQGEKVSSPTR